jgi:hypothetical protein
MWNEVLFIKTDVFTLVSYNPLNLNNMASNSETGHSVNISNYKLLIDNCSAFGAAYNPGNTRLRVVDMTAQWTLADTAHSDLTRAIQSAKGPINDRQILFAPVDKLVTRTLNYLMSTDASEQIKADAKGLAVRFRGSDVRVKKLEDGTPDPNHVSNSHLGFVQRADTFKQLVDLYHDEANYDPNETELKVSTLANLAADMKAANDQIGNIIAPVNNLRIARDKALYEEQTGVVDTALACKAYVKSVFGAKGAETALVMRIKFTKKKI